MAVNVRNQRLQDREEASMKSTMILSDCLSAMKKMVDGCIDLTVTSPPYDDLRKYNGYIFDFEPIAREIYRVTKQGGVVVWVVGDATKKGSESGTSFRQALYFMECGFNLHDTMIYAKAGTGACGSNLSYWQTWEYMFVFSKGKPQSINLIEDVINAHTGTKSVRPKDGHSGRRSKEGDGKDGGKVRYVKTVSRRTNIWRYLVGAFNSDEKTGHPAPFPLQLAKDHIISWSKEGDTVMDPFTGSGTTGVACKELKRNFIGIEMSPEYFAIAKARINA
jgi:DNA modification methylase